VQTRRDFLRLGAVALAPVASVVATSDDQKDSFKPWPREKRTAVRHAVDMRARLLAIVSTWPPDRIHALADRIEAERQPPIGRAVRPPAAYQTGFQNPEVERELGRLLGVLGHVKLRHLGGWYGAIRGGLA